MTSVSYVAHDIKSLDLADAGRRKIEWADRQMPVLAAIRARFEQERPLAGLRIASCQHVTTETANLMRTLKAAGAEVVLCASNPLSTQDEVAAAMVVHYGIGVFAIRGVDADGYYRHLDAAIDTKPNFCIDDGADVIGLMHSTRDDALADMMAASEETTTGVIRLRALEAQGRLAFPVIAVNDAQTKHLLDNRYGTGQSTLDGIIRATNVLLAGKVFVVGGYGWCGRGLATRARRMGGPVVVTEIDPIRALEAVMDGFQVMTMEEAAPIADIVITVTGNLNVLDRQLRKLKDGALIGNSGHFNDEINIAFLDELTESRRRVREFVEEFKLFDGRKIYLLADGRLLNLAAAAGHPAAVMDMS